MSDPFDPIVRPLMLALAPFAAAVIVFDRFGPAHALYANADAADLAPVLRAVLVELEAGGPRI